MTRAQQASEQASIEKFVNNTVRKVRPKGTNAAVTHVLVAAAYAAANSASRTATGAINKDEALKTFQETARLMRGFAAKRGVSR